MVDSTTTVSVHRISSVLISVKKTHPDEVICDFSLVKATAVVEHYHKEIAISFNIFFVVNFDFVAASSTTLISELFYSMWKIYSIIDCILDLNV